MNANKNTTYVSIIGQIATAVTMMMLPKNEEWKKLLPEAVTNTHQQKIIKKEITMPGRVVSNRNVLK